MNLKKKIKKTRSGKFLKKIWNAVRSPEQIEIPVTVYPKSSSSVKGRALVCYLADPILWRDDNDKFNWHSNCWESKEIARILSELGYVVDIVNYNVNFYPTQQYDVVFDLHEKLSLWYPFLKKSTVKLLHLTGSYPKFTNDEVMKRTSAFEKRKNTYHLPKSMSPYPELVDKSLEIADFCSLLGNKEILKTYPEKWQSKINLIPVTSSPLPYKKTVSEFVPEEREFLWFFGGGVMRKGLDLVLEAFSKNPDLIINLVGIFNNEQDFCKVYERELTNLPNIKNHGQMAPSNKKFIDIVKKCFCFVAPSCSESTSTAVVTCLQLGLYPIVSRRTGVDLPDECGIYLETCGIDEIENSIKKAKFMYKKDLNNQINQTQKYALETFSRKQFTLKMTRYFEKSCGKNKTLNLETLV